MIDFFSFLTITFLLHGMVKKSLRQKNSKVARKSVIYAAFLVFLFYGMSVLATTHLNLQGYLVESPDGSLPFIIQSLLPKGLQGITYAVLFAVCATTLSGVWNAMSSMLITDFLNKNQTADYRWSLSLTFLCALTSYVLGNTLVDRILDKLILANIPTFALSFALLAGFYWKRASSFGAVSSSIVGLLWGMGCYYYLGESGFYTWTWVIYGLPLIFLTGIVGSLIVPKQKMHLTYANNKSHN